MQKIAIVDDAPDNRDFLYYLLRDHYEIMLYDNGEQALKELHQNLPDLIIMDIWLHGIDGTEVLKRIRKDDLISEVPVVALTANAMLGDREKYLAAGFDEYVPKPILEIENFVATVRALISRNKPK
jgi:CheY-like chemotaxis protein